MVNFSKSTENYWLNSCFFVVVLFDFIGRFSIQKRDKDQLSTPLWSSRVLHSCYVTGFGAAQLRNFPVFSDLQYSSFHNYLMDLVK